MVTSGGIYAGTDEDDGGGRTNDDRDETDESDAEEGFGGTYDEPMATPGGRDSMSGTSKSRPGL